MSSSVTEAILREKFAQFGRVDNVDLLGSSNCAFIHMGSEDAAKKAAEAMHGCFMGTGHSQYRGETGLPIKVNFADSGRHNSPKSQEKEPKPEPVLKKKQAIRKEGTSVTEETKSKANTQLKSDPNAQIVNQIPLPKPKAK